MPRGKPNAGPGPREEAVRKARALRVARKAELPPSHTDLADKIRLLMELRGMTQSSLSRVTKQLYEQRQVLAYVHQTRVSKWILRTGEPNHAQTHALAVALAVPLMYLADPTRVERPDLRALECEREVESAVRRLGHGPSLDRLSLRASVEVVSTRPSEGEVSYGQQRAAGPKAHRGGA